MKLIPFFYSKKETNEFTIYTLRLFTERAGKSIWKADGQLSADEISRDHMEPNGLFSKRVLINKDIAFIEIDSEKTNLNDFFSYEEALANPDKPECWRKFYFFIDKRNESWWSSKDIQTDLEETGSVHFLFEDILRLFA